VLAVDINFKECFSQSLSVSVALIVAIIGAITVSVFYHAVFGRRVT
jgi:hypothetical protein